MGTYVELLKACKEGNSKKVKKLLVNCSEISDVRDLSDKTVLHYCFKFEPVVDLILEAAPDLLDIGEKNGYTVLHLASMIKPPTSLKHLLSKKPDINKRNNDSRSALLLAVMYDNYEAVQMLCENDADVNAVDTSGVSPLHYAARIKSDKENEDETKIINILLQYGSKIECLDFYERSPLMWAVCSNNIIKMRHLINKGANIYVRDAGGLSILHYAVSNGNLEIIQILIDDYKFDVESRDINQCTSLMYACTYNNLDVIQILLEKGADVNAVDCKRRSAAHFASGKGNLRNLELLHKFDIDLWQLNSDSNYPLHESAYKGHFDVLQFLLDQLEPNHLSNNYINHKNSNGQTALHLATVKDNLKICSSLLKSGSDPNITLRVSNGKSMTALDLANKEETKKLIREYNGKTAYDLLKTSVIDEELSNSCNDDISETSNRTISRNSDNEIDSNNINSLDNESLQPKSPTEVVENDLAEVQDEIVPKNEIGKITDEYKNMLLSSCYNGDSNEITLFVQNGGNLSEISDEIGRTLLHYSLKNKESFELIIENAPELINKSDNFNHSILHMVIMSKDNSRLQLLLDNNADYNFPDFNGRTALHLGVLLNNIEALEMINNSVTDKTTIHHFPDVDRNYPLHYAVQICKINKIVCQCREIIELLLHMNGDIECRDNINRTPLLLAINIKNFEAVSVLLKHGANIMAKDNQDLCSIHYVCSEGSLEIFNELANIDSFDPDVKDPNGLTPIFYAISSCNEKLVNRLIELHAKLDITDQHGRNVCHKAAEKGAFKCLEILLSYNVNPWLKSNDGTMPLHEAAYRGYKEIAEILLNSESAATNVNSKNNSGQTALHLAAVRNDCPMCFLLISKGSHVNELLHINNNQAEDLTPYDLATTNDCKETLYTFGGRSAKRIVDCINIDNEFENEIYFEELEILNMNNPIFEPRPSIRSTELALSTMPSIIYTTHTNRVSNRSPSSQPPPSPKQSSRVSEKSKKSCKKNNIITVVDKSDADLTPVINEIEQNISTFDIDEPIAIESPTEIESVADIHSEMENNHLSPSVIQTVEQSEISFRKSSILSSKRPSVTKTNSRAKSTICDTRSNTTDKIIKDKVQNSVLNYEYYRINCKKSIEKARQRIRAENSKKLINLKPPKSARK